MNVLKNHIIEIHSVQPYEKDDGYVRVDITTDCWGRKERDTHVWKIESWEKFKKQGYYMG